MNYLAHLFLALPEGQSLTGNLLGDFTRGITLEDLPPRIALGLKNHRAIDSYTDSHEITQDLRRLFSVKRRRLAGIILDVVFDHFLIKYWNHYHPASVEDFLRQCYSGLAEQHHHMPKQMQGAVTRMAGSNWLLGYAELQGVGFALDRMAERRTVAAKLTGAIVELEYNYDAIEAGFRAFFPELIEDVYSRGIEGWRRPTQTVGRIN